MANSNLQHNGPGPNSEGGLDAISDQAADWSDRLQYHKNAPALREEFERWLSARPEHAAAFKRIDAAHQLARSLKHTAPMLELERETLARVAQRRSKTRRWQSVAAAACLVLAVGVGFAVTNNGFRQDMAYLWDRAYYAALGDPLYHTTVGKRLSVTLDDGSELILNTDSRVAVQYRDGERHIALRRGQALFEVAHDTSRPFTVTAGERLITAIGTAFDVKMAEERFEVVLIEGRVSIADDQTESDENASKDAVTDDETGSTNHPKVHILAAGEEFVATKAASAPIIRPANVARATSWRDGHLIFRNDRLADAVAEVNRYSERQIILADTAITNLSVSGVINTGDTRVFVNTMIRYYPVKILSENKRQIVLGSSDINPS